jgi:hypothetical protein
VNIRRVIVIIDIVKVYHFRGLFLWPTEAATKPRLPVPGWKE